MLEVELSDHNERKKYSEIVAMTTDVIEKFKERLKNAAMFV